MERVLLSRSSHHALHWATFFHTPEVPWGTVSSICEFAARSQITEVAVGLPSTIHECSHWFILGKMWLINMSWNSSGREKCSWCFGPDALRDPRLPGQELSPWKLCMRLCWALLLSWMSGTQLPFQRGGRELSSHSVFSQVRVREKGTEIPKFESKHTYSELNAFEQVVYSFAFWALELKSSSATEGSCPGQTCGERAEGQWWRREFSPSLCSCSVSKAVMNPFRQDAQHRIDNSSCLIKKELRFSNSYSHKEADPQKPKNPGVGNCRRLR